MTPPDWTRLFVVDGRVRSAWRILLFAGLFLALAGTGSALVRVLPIAAAVPGIGTSWIPLAAALGAGWILLTRIDDRPPGALGFAWTTRTPREIIAGLAIGAIALGLAVAAVALVGWIGFVPDEGDAWGYIAAVADDLVFFSVAAAAEEAIFRGYPFQVLAQALGPVAATVGLSAAFAAAHAWNPNVGALALVNIFLAGVMLSAAYLRTRSLWFATAVHAGWNWSMASLFDLPVSGLVEGFDTPLYEPVLVGPAWATGGAFGPEGGIAASLALLAALWVILRWPGLDEAPEMKALRPLVDEEGEFERRV